MARHYATSLAIQKMSDDSQDAPTRSGSTVWQHCIIRDMIQH